jgi:hypothetical protein
MPGTAVNLGTGTTITFGTSGFSAELVAITNWSGIATSVVDTTPLSITPAPAGQIGNKRFLAAHAVDPGTLECVFHFNPDLTPPIGQAAELITISWPLVPGDATSAYWTCMGQMITYEIRGIELDTKMECSCSIKLTGSISITVAT